MEVRREWPVFVVVGSGGVLFRVQEDLHDPREPDTIPYVYRKIVYRVIKLGERALHGLERVVKVAQRL